jgi:hypothetical protein
MPKSCSSTSPERTADAPTQVPAGLFASGEQGRLFFCSSTRCAAKPRCCAARPPLRRTLFASGSASAISDRKESCGCSIRKGALYTGLTPSIARYLVDPHKLGHLSPNGRRTKVHRRSMGEVVGRHVSRNATGPGEKDTCQYKSRRLPAPARCLNRSSARIHAGS